MALASASALILVASTWTAPPSAYVVARQMRTRPLYCSDAAPDRVEAIPPGQLADAWQREEQAKELDNLLKGCSLYLVGIGPKRAMVGRVLSRRLPNYRCYDVGSLMCSTYKAISGVDEDVTLPELMAAEPLTDVVQLSDLVMREVQAFKRAIVTVWDGCIKPSDYMIMQQGIVVNLAFSETGDLALPKEDAEATLELWNNGHKKADVTVQLEPNMAADDAAFKTIETMLKFINDNPGRSKEWKEKADEALKAKEGNA